GFEFATSHKYDAIVLDLMVPGMDGFKILTELRAKADETPIIITSALDSMENRVEGLNAGADDYLIKPFALPELIARIQAQTRKTYGKKTAAIEIGDLKVDLNRKRVTRGEREIVLTKREYGLLEYLAYRTGEIVSRQEIWEHVYQDSEGGSSNAVDVYVSYLRKKLNEGDEPNLLHTRRGQGYFLDPNEGS
ncbi:response regulator transcription factor, partial [Akkermansiaceae bacterium]|nr:response regulator transcription factor [Akkermansiaceae bacterium]